MRPQDAHVADRRPVRRDRPARWLVAGLLAGAAVALAGAGWWGWQLKTDLALREAAIEQLARRNETLLDAQAQAQKLEAQVEALSRTFEDQQRAIGLLADLQDGRLDMPANLPTKMADADARRIQIAAALERLSTRHGFAATDQESVSDRLTDALDRALADQAAAEVALRALAAKSAALATELDQKDAELAATKEQFQTWVKQHYGMLRGVLRTSGMRVDPLVEQAQAKLSGEGGPYVPLSLTDPRAGRSTLVPLPPELGEDARAVDLLSGILTVLPLGMPVVDAETRSGFGIRVDPFTRRKAMHTGLDFTPGSDGLAAATGPGSVTFAGRAGAYGNMVEVDHGFGVKTRYAHLAGIEVKLGQQVTQGMVVGRIGSTGRSTGRHLHYEIRVDGVAVDPADFLEARVRLAHVLSQE